MRAPGGYVYIMSNKSNKVLYTGMTAYLYSRVTKHRNGEGCHFTKKYNCTKLVYFEILDSIVGAIKREKCIKSYPRKWKIDLINSINPEWRDLYDDIVGMD